jgi:hypothetical protein
MDIIKKPTKQTTNSDRTVAKAGKAPGSAGKTAVLFRFRDDFLQRIDAAARKQELPRQAWVRAIIAEALEAKGL